MLIRSDSCWYSAFAAGMACFQGWSKYLGVFLTAAHQVHNEAGTYLPAGSVPAKKMKSAADPLASKKCADQNREGYELPAQAGEKSERYHQGYRRMDRKKPSGRKLPLICPPVPEGKIKNKDKNSDGKNFQSFLR